MKIIPSKEEFIKGYLYKNGLDEVAFDKLEIVHFKYPSPSDPYYGTGVVSAIADAYNINENMNRYENSLFTNMARPDGILTTDLPINENEHKRMSNEWNQRYGGVKKVGKTAILTNGLKYQQISINPKDLNFLEGRRVTKEEIVNGFGQTLALYDKDANRANSDAAIYMLMRDAISPRHRRNEQKINEQILPRYDERLFCVYENCIPEDRVFLQKTRIENVGAGIISRNEARMEEGKDELEGLDEIYIDSNLVPIDTRPDEKEIDEVSGKIAERVKEKLNV